jgi:hypothetical protein
MTNENKIELTIFALLVMVLLFVNFYTTKKVGKFIKVFEHYLDREEQIKKRIIDQYQIERGQSWENTKQSMNLQI